MHNGEIADRFRVETALAYAAGDRDPPRSLERRITISCHAPLSGTNYLSIDRGGDTSAVQSCQPLSIDRARQCRVVLAGTEQRPLLDQAGDDTLDERDFRIFEARRNRLS